MVEALPGTVEPATGARLPAEIFSLIAEELATIRCFQTLASMSSASRDHYFLLRPVLYRHFYLNAKSSTILLEFKSTSSPGTALTTSTSFTSIRDRAKFMETITVEEMPHTAVWLKLDRFLESRTTTGSSLPLENGILFPKLRTMVFADISRQGWETRVSQDRMENLMRWLGGFMYPEYICLHYSDVSPEDYSEDTASLPFISNPWIITNILCAFAEARPSTVPPIRSVSMHNFWLSCPSPLDNVPNIHQVDVYFGESQADCSKDLALPNRILPRFERIEDLAIVFGSSQDPRTVYRFHRVLRSAEADILREVPMESELVVGVDLDSDNDRMAWGIWMNRLRRRYTRTFPEDAPRYEHSPYRWSKFRKLVEQTIAFSPEPSPTAKCPHCLVSL